MATRESLRVVHRRQTQYWPIGTVEKGEVSAYRNILQYSSSQTEGWGCYLNNEDGKKGGGEGVQLAFPRAVYRDT